MTIDVTLPLTDPIYERAKRLARLRHQDLISLLADVLANGLLAAEAPLGISQESSEDAALDREMQAYIAMHPLLKEKYFGKYVAIYQEKLIDLADELGPLYERVHARYPDQIVWMSQVKTEPIEIISVRSPRLLPEEPGN